MRRKKFKFVLLVQRISCCVVEPILKYYWRALNVILNKSPINIISPICFQRNCGENGKYKISLKTILKVKKPVEVLN